MLLCFREERRRKHQHEASSKRVFKTSRSNLAIATVCYDLAYHKLANLARQRLQRACPFCVSIKQVFKERGSPHPLICRSKLCPRIRSDMWVLYMTSSSQCTTPTPKTIEWCLWRKGMYEPCVYSTRTIHAWCCVVCVCLCLSVCLCLFLCPCLWLWLCLEKKRRKGGKK
jgi:hypothetical protein